MKMIPSKNKLKVDMLLKVMNMEKIMNMGKVTMKMKRMVKMVKVIMKMGKMNEDGEDENNDDDTNNKTTTTNDKTEEENDENVRSTPTEASSSARDPSTNSTEIVVKIIRFENYNIKMLIDVHGDLESDIVVRSSMGRGFTEYRKILRENEIICDKKDEILINYCGMPVCFGMKEFAIMIGLNCHSPPCVGGAKSATKGEDLFKLVEKSYNKKNLLEHLKSKTVSSNVKKSLCIVWFVHSVLCARDVGKNISSDWIKLSANYEVFNTNLWGRESSNLIVKYLLREL
ncbi:hypothetical protein HAX54_023341 [Datura stramonium]|uniref:DUF1985 domain-containing protein n=1 Tax=Datura stramonium TaxID=4076 RepID=A0ABS8UYZ6_DATST|nr:hypothetical protein [Datura stramonium]